MREQHRRNGHTVATLQEAVVLLREEGCSYGAIAKKYGISKSYAIKLVQQHEAKMRRASAGHIDLTARQRLFARALINGRSPLEAALFAARPGTLSPDQARKWAELTLADERFRLAIGQIFGLQNGSSDRTVDDRPPSPVAHSSTTKSSPLIRLFRPNPSTELAG